MHKNKCDKLYLCARHFHTLANIWSDADLRGKSPQRDASVILKLNWSE